MRISRATARARVEKAIAETRPESTSMAWDMAWRGIRRLEARNIGDDARLAEELAEKMRAAAKRS